MAFSPTKLLSTLSLFGFVSSTFAAPSVSTDSLQLRHDLLLLKDSGQIEGPVMAWPYPTARTYTSSSKSSEPSTDYQLPRTNIEDVYSQQSQLGWNSATTTLAFASSPLPFRSFGYQPREEFESTFSASFLSTWTSGTLNVTYDGDELHLDGSSFAIAIGNWSAAIDQVSRWWGPGWDGSLILSNNARPIPAISLTRIDDKPFEHPLLHWIGPWTATTFMGQLDNDEGDRDGSNARLFGIRFETSPFNWNWLDIGLSRTAQWAGDGRPQSWETFKMLLLGEDNRTPNSNVTEETEPGNQLAGGDYRITIPQWNFAQYGQIVGEDEDGFLPDANMLLFGAETWGTLNSLNATWRAYYEWSDTRAGHLLAHSRNDKGVNAAYNHGIYRTGYRSEGQSMGHAIDGDSLMHSLGFFLIPESGNLYGLKIRDYQINRDGTGIHGISQAPLDGNSLEAFASLQIENRRLKIWSDTPIQLNIGLFYNQEKNLTNNQTDTDLGGYLSITAKL